MLAEPARWQSKPDLALCPEALYDVALPAANSYTRFVWITLRALRNSGRCWAQASLSVRSRKPVAFATTFISHEDFAIGPVTRLATTLEEMIAPTEQCAPVLAKVRHWLTTSDWW
jgi:hypothetical protein